MMSRLLFMLFGLAVLSLPSKGQAFDCNRESLYQELKEIQSRIERETQALHKKHEKSRKPSDALLANPHQSTAMGRIGRDIYLKRLKREEQERVDLAAKHQQQVSNFRDMVTIFCK